MKCYDKAARTALFNGYYSKVIIFLTTAIELGATAKMSAFERTKPFVKLIQWHLEIAKCYSNLGDFINSENFNSKANSIAEINNFIIDEDSVEPFLAQKSSARRKGVMITGVNSEHLTKVLQTKQDKVIAAEAKSNGCCIL